MMTKNTPNKQCADTPFEVCLTYDGCNDCPSCNYWNAARLLLPHSNCLKRQYACVIVKGGYIISKGYNTSLVACTTCARMDIEHNIGDYAECQSVHAEQAALIKARENSLQGAELYLVCADEVDPIPCPTCQKLLDWSGVKQVKEVQGEDNL